MLDKLPVFQSNRQFMRIKIKIRSKIKIKSQKPPPKKVKCFPHRTSKGGGGGGVRVEGRESRGIARWATLRSLDTRHSPLSLLQFERHGQEMGV
jgi:hypothetical protein